MEYPPPDAAAQASSHRWAVQSTQQNGPHRKQIKLTGGYP